MTLGPATPAPAPAESPAVPLKRHVYIETMGCQMNVYDSDRMFDALTRHGYVQTENVELADLVLLNTCSIRDKVEHKMMSMLGSLRKLKAHNPDLVLGITGCVAQQEGERLLKRVPGLDLVLGPDQIGRLPELVAAIRTEQHRTSAIEFVHRRNYVFPEALPPQDGRVAAMVTVMKGCNKVCSFCIVPFTRGREVSKPSADVVAEVEMLVRHGVREVMLLGQNVNSYGKDRAGELDFAGLLRAVDAIDGLHRIRFMTSHPMDCTDALIDAFGDLKKLCPFFHLPIQSGSESVLTGMRRAHGVTDYLEHIDRLRARVPGIALSTDIIVGFPGETEEDFTRTIELLERVRYASIYSFIYSPRPGTRAADLTDDVPDEIKKERLARVQALQDRITADTLASFQGQVTEVLFEGPARVNQAAPNTRLGGVRLEGPPQMSGRNPQNLKVNVPTTDAAAFAEWPGRLGRVEIERVKAHSLLGKLIGWV